MRDNKSEQLEECFIDPETDDIEQPQEDLTLNIPNRLPSELPANELRTVRRPDNIAPRTFFLERSFYQLKAPLNSPCQELPSLVETGKLKLKIANNQNLSLEEYFGKKKFKCVYNRLQTYGRDSKSFQGRLKSVDSLVDFNYKSFKELEEEKQRVVGTEDVIDADFESGNLCRAYVQVQEPLEYYLLLENDLNTYGYNNWFFFRLRNKDKGRRRFTIVNLIKKSNFFHRGMLISIFSLQKYKEQQVSWFKGGDRVSFGNINLSRNHHLSEQYHFLSFEYEFTHEQDEVYFALNQPYTYTRLKEFIECSKHKFGAHHIGIEVKTVGYSISNNIIPSLRVFKEEEGRVKDIILILGRQHPCQTVGSFIAEEIVRYLTQVNEINTFLLKNYDIVMIPMVNPDGVIHGSSRCNMAGLDLNRQWGDYIVKELTPQTVKIKQFITGLAKSQKIKYMIDLHGHGKKLNSFFFSCKENEKEDVRLLSTIMKKLEPRFSIEGCTYGITRDKENTIRSTINSMGIAHSYTLQTSLFGWQKQLDQVKHFNEDDYRQIATSLVQSIFVMEADPKTTLRELGLSKEGIVGEVDGGGDKHSKEDRLREEDPDILSDSDPEGDRLDSDELLGKCLNKALQKKIKQELDLESKMKHKKQKGKKIERSSSKSKNNTRQTCPTALNTRSKIIPSPASQNLGLQSCSTKKISLSQKWKERRKEIEKKKNEAQKGAWDAQLEQSKNHTKLGNRPRLKTENNLSKPSKGLLPYSTFMAKNHLSKTKHLHQKIKTEFQEFQEINLPTEQEIKQTEARKSALETKYNQLKQESLNMLLTDTLSVLKIAPPEKNLSPEIRANKTYISKTKKQRLITEPEPVIHKSSKIVATGEGRGRVVVASEEGRGRVGPEEGRGTLQDSMRYRKFRHFLSGGSVKKKGEEGNSVFYHFPVL